MGPSFHWGRKLLGEPIAVRFGLLKSLDLGGIRIENDYLVTADRVTNLLDFPMELA